MPNHVINEIVLHGVALDRAKPKILNSEGELDFAVLVPLPIFFWPGCVGRPEADAFPGNHIDAALSTWGTKWGPYQLGPDSVTERKGDTVLVFQTANNPPRGWIVALFNTFECNITAKYLSEGGIAGHVEHYEIKCPSMLNGPAWKAEEIAEGTAEYKRLHFLLWGVEEFDDGY